MSNAQLAARMSCFFWWEHALVISHDLQPNYDHKSAIYLDKDIS